LTGACCTAPTPVYCRVNHHPRTQYTHYLSIHCLSLSLSLSRPSTAVSITTHAPSTPTTSLSTVSLSIHSLSLSLLQVLRASRAFRVFKLAKRWDALQTFINSFVKAAMSLGPFMCLVTMLVFVAALLGRALFAGLMEQRLNYDTLFWATVTTFQVRVIQPHKRARRANESRSHARRRFPKLTRLILDWALCRFFSSLVLRHRRP
jgi:hypothetical protein